jgi:superfamily II DNA or RNA helicase
LMQSQVFIFDESHTCPADTFERVCMGIAVKAPYRYFCSATQVRADGSELLLKGIIGPVVYGKSFKELVEGGYLARPIFRVFKVPAYGSANKPDPNKETREQLFCNPHVVKLASDITMKAVASNRKVLILIDELSQNALLKNHLMHEYSFICGDTPQEERKKIIADFNAGKINILVGTTAISMGVDLKPVGCLIYLQGGMSEVQVKQSIGRGTILVAGKTDVWVVDFMVVGSKTMERHVGARMMLYEDMGDVKVIG